MPIAPTYPGVYIEEIPSGVRTITGVSTSVAAFVGSAKRGPINKAMRILSYTDYERKFGGLASNSEMSYAVRQFFMNGGSEAWVVRLANGAQAASMPLLDNSSRNVLTIEALEEGKAGTDIEVRIDYQTDNTASTFNLFLNYVSKDNPAENATEIFKNLSMNSQDPRYVKDIINGNSRLIKIERNVETNVLSELDKGTSVSGDLVDSDGNLLDVASILDDTHNQLQISINGLPAIPVQIDLPSDVSGDDSSKHLKSLCEAIQRKVRESEAAKGNNALSKFTCEQDGNQIKMTSGVGGEFSSVHVLPGERNDASYRLKLGTLQGGIETDAVAEIRPAEVPEHGMLRSEVITDIDKLSSEEADSLQIRLDRYGPNTISIAGEAVEGGSPVEKLSNIALRIETSVRALKQSNPAYKGFTCTAAADTNQLVLTSGTRGPDSSVLVSASPDPNKDIAAKLGLLNNIERNHPKNRMLQGGEDGSYNEEVAYNLFIADRSQRQGIYALEDVDLFNLLCLPGVTDSGILMDAGSYCKERRAFLIADAPKNQKPDDMVTAISGPSLPKTDYGAVYYPWISIADPLKNGNLRNCPPSGTIAGLYARTDTARGVWKAPAGTDATLVGVQAAEYKLTDGENGTLNPLGVNCLRIFPVYGAVAWGSRTLRGADQMTSEYKYIPIRRLALFIEESLYRGSKWVVFEPNDEPLWSQIRLNIGAFMHTLFRQGAFQGKTPKEAYFVKCDSETTTQNDINLGIVNIVVGFAPLKPAEFVIIKIQQMAGQIQT